MVPINLLPQIINILSDPSGGLGPVVALTIPSLSHNPLGLVDILHKWFGPVIGVIPLPHRLH